MMKRVCACPLAVLPIYLILCPHEQRWAWQKPPLPPQHQLSVLPPQRFLAATRRPRIREAPRPTNVPQRLLRCRCRLRVHGSLQSSSLSLSLARACPSKYYSVQLYQRQKDATQREETRENKPMAHFITLCRPTLRTSSPVHSCTPAPRSPAALVSCRAVA